MLAVKHLNWRGGSCKLVGGLCVDKTPWFIFHLTQLLSQVEHLRVNNNILKKKKVLYFAAKN